MLTLQTWREYISWSLDDKLPEAAPNPLVAPLHPKAMPVILAEDDYDSWLTADYETACALATPYPSQLMAVA